VNVTLTRIEQTCPACPSQWDAWDADGTYYYIRFRWGLLTVSTGDVANVVFGLAHGHPLDGTMMTGEMLRLTGLKVACAQRMKDRQCVLPDRSHVEATS
jgi:hypothetical protein